MGYIGGAVGVGVGVSVSAGSNGLGVGEAFAANFMIVGVLAATASTGLGSPLPQAVINQAIMNTTEIFFIRKYSPISVIRLVIITQM